VVFIFFLSLFLKKDLTKLNYSYNKQHYVYGIIRFVCKKVGNEIWIGACYLQKRIKPFSRGLILFFETVDEFLEIVARISQSLLKLAKTTFGLFAATVGSCLALNITASDQYLAIVVPGKMFAKAYKDRGLAPENLSRTIEDTGTVTSVLIPWNTCGAYHSATLGVSTFDYLPYAFFNIISLFMTLVFAAFSIKIRMLGEKGLKV